MFLQKIMCKWNCTFDVHVKKKNRALKRKPVLIFLKYTKKTFEFLVTKGAKAAKALTQIISKIDRINKL